MSAILPNGTRNTAAARRYEVATQFNSTASIENCFPIEGSAIFTEDPIKGVMNAATEAIISVVFLLTLLVLFIIWLNLTDLSKLTHESNLVQLSSYRS
jgi:hypothetical protein